MSLQDVRVGFVGCGRHATEVLLPAVHAAGMELASVCDLDRRRAQRTNRRFGAFRPYQDLRKMIDEMDLDAVLVCGPPEMHSEAATVALERGCHVWVEMPAAPTADEADSIAQLAATRGLIAQPGLMMRFAPAYRRLRDIVTGEDFGQALAMSITWWPPLRDGHDDPLLFDAPHVLDLARFMLGEIEGVCALCAAPQRASLALSFASGATGTISFVAGAARSHESVFIAGTNSLASAEGRRDLAVHRRDTDEITLWRVDSATAEGHGNADQLGYLLEIESFGRSVLGEEEPRATMEDAAAAMRLAERVAASEEVRSSP